MGIFYLPEILLFSTPRQDAFTTNQLINHGTNSKQTQKLSC